MRWLLIPLCLLVLLAPGQRCERRSFLRDAAGAYLVPPLSFGHPLAFWGTDLAGRDLGCLVARGARQSLLLAFIAFGLGVGPGLILGLMLAARGWGLGLGGTLFVLAGLLLVFGPGSYRFVLALGVALHLARGIATEIKPREPGGGFWPGLRLQGWPRLTGLIVSSLGALPLWMAELGALGLYDPLGADRVREGGFGSPEPDLAQLIAFFRFTWLAAPEQLFFPVAALVALSLGFSDLGRWLGRIGSNPKGWMAGLKRLSGDAPQKP